MTDQQRATQLPLWDQSQQWGVKKTNKRKAAAKCALAHFSRQTIIGYMEQAGVYGLYYLLTTHMWVWLPNQGCWSKQGNPTKYSPNIGVA